MKRITLLGCLLTAFATLCAQHKEKRDTLQSFGLQEVEVLSTRATGTTPIAYTNIGEKKIRMYNAGVDLPYIVSMTPGAITTSDAGTGIGYTTLRVRGTDGTRINVTANGIPVNDAESHTVFWVNLPDFASSVKDIQIQRGVGTSTNGAGSFGASMNLRTGSMSLQPYTEFSASAGSFGTHKETLKMGTGLIGEHWTFDARLSNIASDGYIERASSSLKSYYLQAAYYADNTAVRLITFAGNEETYHAWNYASKEEMRLYGRRYNSCGYTHTDDNGKAHYYNDQTDNYRQRNYQLLIDHHLGNRVSMNIGLHYTKGDGYYQEYKTERKLAEYALEPFTHDGETVKKSDLVRRKAMDNHFGGAVFSLNYKDSRLNATVGGALNRYTGDHFGNVLWVKNYIGNLDAAHEYYRNRGTKDDGNIYMKADYSIASSLNAYLDLQYRRIDYAIEGCNDKWNGSAGALQQLDIDETFGFFNPKAGLSWQIDKHNRLFGSVSIAHKEPTRNNYTDGKLHSQPRAEKLTDYELGYTFGSNRMHAGLNLYYMHYKDQLALTGELNEIGEPLADNIPDSYRAGIELTASAALPFGFNWEANATFSRNRIKDFTEVLYDDDTYEKWEIAHGETPIAFSPDIIANNILSYSNKGLCLSVHTQYVGKQYMSNAQQSDHLLDAYIVSNLYASYTFNLRGTKSITVGANIYNLFNEEYENNGYAGSGYYTANGEKIRYNYAGYAAQAGTNFLGHVAINF